MNRQEVRDSIRELREWAELDESSESTMSIAKYLLQKLKSDARYEGVVLTYAGERSIGMGTEGPVIRVDVKHGGLKADLPEITQELLDTAKEFLGRRYKKVQGWTIRNGEAMEFRVGDPIEQK